MIDAQDSSIPHNDETEPDLSLPRFDGEANAHAQPVQPIPLSRASVLRNCVGTIGCGIQTKFGALAIVVIAGLMTGTLSGMALVKMGQKTDMPATSESVSEVVPSSTFSAGELRGEVLGFRELPSAHAETRISKIRTRPQSRREPRAYLVDVLR